METVDSHTVDNELPLWIKIEICTKALEYYQNELKNPNDEGVCGMCDVLDNEIFQILRSNDSILELCGYTPFPKLFPEFQTYNPHKEDDYNPHDPWWFDTFDARSRFDIISSLLDDLKKQQNIIETT